MEKEVIIVGAGLAGSLWAVYLTNAGYKVSIYESRPDIRKAEIKAGKSIKWLTNFKAFSRFFLHIFRKRKIIE